MINKYLNISEEKREEAITVDQSHLDFVLENDNLAKEAYEYQKQEASFQELVFAMNSINGTGRNFYFLQKALISENQEAKLFAQNIMFAYKLMANKNEIGTELIITEEILLSDHYAFYNNINLFENVLGKKGRIIYPSVKARKDANPFNGDNLIIPSIIEIID